MAQRIYDGKVVDEIYVVNPGSGGGGGGGEVTIPEGGDATVGSTTDAPATDPAAPNTVVSLNKAQTAGILELAKSIGPRLPGNTTDRSLVTGGIYNSSLSLRTNGAPSAIELDERGLVRVRLHGTTWNGVDGAPNQLATLNGGNDGAGGSKPLATALMGLDRGTGTWNRLTMNGLKGLYVSVAAPDTVYGSVTAQSVTGTTEATASLIATINNTGRRYKKAVIYVKNLSTIAFNSFLIKTKPWPGRAGYDTTYAGGEYIPPRGYLQEVSIDPTTLVDGECKIVMDISLIESIELRATVLSAAPGTTATAEWEIVDV